MAIFTERKLFYSVCLHLTCSQMDNLKNGSKNKTCATNYQYIAITSPNVCRYWNSADTLPVSLVSSVPYYHRKKTAMVLSNVQTSKLHDIVGLCLLLVCCMAHYKHLPMVFWCWWETNRRIVKLGLGLNDRNFRQKLSFVVLHGLLGIHNGLSPV